MSVKITEQTLPIELKWDDEVTQEDLEDFSNCPSLPQSLFQLQSNIAEQYRSLPWPSELNQITLMTEVRGGRGDISAAAKVIKVMQGMCPTLLFNWIVTQEGYDLPAFLQGADLSKIHIATSSSLPKEPVPAHFLVVGPVETGWGINYIEGKFKIALQGPRFDFLENSTPVSKKMFVFCAADAVRKEGSQENLTELYRKVHKFLFSNPLDSQRGLAMGLRKGSGVFLDKGRMSAPLSREYYCPSYLMQLEDAGLKQDIFNALAVSDEQTLPDYDKNSLNSGYAHWSSSWAKFIDFTAIHERKKNVTIVLNQCGFRNELSTANFCKEVFTKERLALLKKWGYGAVTVKGEEKDPVILQEAANAEERTLTVIVRPSFKPNDMKQLQLASERLLATGDNTAAEAWAARCQLYLYEDVHNGGCKDLFLKQQIEIANTISPALGTLLQIFGGNNGSTLSEEKMAQVADILKEPSLGQQMLQFCNHITENYSFQGALEGALKRAAWHHCLPELMNEEADIMDEEFKRGVCNLLKSADTPPQVINFKSLPLLKERVALKAQEHLATSAMK